MKMKYVGWQLGITYQSARPEGIDFPYLQAVIDRSAAAGMNFISLMMLSYGYFDPGHDGYAWPVKNQRLKPLVDAQCRNAQPATEFVRRALEYAKRKGLHTQLMMNSLIWNPAKVKLAYPDAVAQCSSNGERETNGWLFCPDSPGGWQLALDEVEDLLDFYRDAPVDSFIFERVGYTDGACFCEYSRAKRELETGRKMDQDPLSFLIWKGNATQHHLNKYRDHIRQFRPDLDVWIHTGGDPGWGHFPHVLRQAGFKVVSNHGQHFLPTEKAFHQQLDWLAPLDCVPHICVRDMPTANYPVPIRTPEMIRGYAQWLESYPGARVKGAIFFNEAHTTERNKAVVYELARRWQG